VSIKLAAIVSTALVSGAHYWTIYDPTDIFFLIQEIIILPEK